MHRQNRKSYRRAERSTESVLHQCAGHPFCPKCQQFVRHQDAVWVGRHQFRCPVCAELLEQAPMRTAKPT